MSGKINNRTLLIVFAGLIGILLITKLVTSEKSVRTLDTELIDIDTSRITSILLYPRSETGEEILFERSGSKWTVSSNGVSASADANSLIRSLSELVNLKTERLVARSKDKWGEFQVSDSLSTRLVISEGKKKTLDLVIGRFDYQPPPGGQGYQGYQQNQFSGVSYIRLYSESEVYAVEGFLGLSFNQSFNTWRLQSISSLNQSQVSKLVFDYPSDSGFIAQRSETGWMVAGLSADSASVAQYLSGISQKRSSAFEDGFQPSSAPDYQLTIEGDNMTPVLIRAFNQAGGDVILNSSLNPQSYFRTTKNDLFSDFFKRTVDFLN